MKRVQPRHTPILNAVNPWKSLSVLVLLGSISVHAQVPDSLSQSPGVDPSPQTDSIQQPVEVLPSAGIATADTTGQAKATPPSTLGGALAADTSQSVSGASTNMATNSVPHASGEPVPEMSPPLENVAPRPPSKRLPQVAVLAFAGDGIEAKDLNAVTSRFESELMATDSFKMVERRNVDKILKEQGFQMSGACDNSECSVEIGQVLSVDGIFTGELAKVGKTWSLSVKRTEVGTGLTTFSHVLDIQGSLEDVLRGGVPEMALIASGRKKPDGERTVLVAKKTQIWPWVVGGSVVVGGGILAAVLLSNDSSNSAPSENGSGSSDPKASPDQMIVRW